MKVLESACGRGEGSERATEAPLTLLRVSMRGWQRANMTRLTLGELLL